MLLIFGTFSHISANRCFPPIGVRRRCDEMHTHTQYKQNRVVSSNSRSKVGGVMVKGPPTRGTCRVPRSSQSLPMRVPVPVGQPLCHVPPGVHGMHSMARSHVRTHIQRTEHRAICQQHSAHTCAPNVRFGQHLHAGSSVNTALSIVLSVCLLVCNLVICPRAFAVVAHRSPTKNINTRVAARVHTKSTARSQASKFLFHFGRRRRRSRRQYRNRFYH